MNQPQTSREFLSGAKSVSITPCGPSPKSGERSVVDFLSAVTSRTVDLGLSQAKTALLTVVGSVAAICTLAGGVQLAENVNIALMDAPHPIATMSSSTSILNILNDRYSGLFERYGDKSVFVVTTQQEVDKLAEKMTFHDNVIKSSAKDNAKNSHVEASAVHLNGFLGSQDRVLVLMDEDERVPVVDHEMYHAWSALSDSRYSMTDIAEEYSELATAYERYVEECSADAFMALMAKKDLSHELVGNAAVKKYFSVNDLVNTPQEDRLKLKDVLEHYTVEVLQAANTVPYDSVKDKTPVELAKMAQGIAQKNAMSFDEYISFLQGSKYFNGIANGLNDSEGVNKAAIFEYALMNHGFIEDRDDKGRVVLEEMERVIMDSSFYHAYRDKNNGIVDVVSRVDMNNSLESWRGSDNSEAVSLNRKPGVR